MVATTVDIPAWLAAISAVLLISATAGAGWSVARTKAVDASLSTLSIANAELRKANDDLRSELLSERARFGSELAAEREKRALLEGRMSMLVDGLAERIVAAVADAWHRTHPTTKDGD